EVGLLAALAGHRFDPTGIDDGRAARVQARGFCQLCGDDPLCLLTLDPARGVKIETDAAGTEIKIPFFRAQSNIAQQPTQERAVQSLVPGIVLLAWRGPRRCALTHTNA